MNKTVWLDSVVFVLNWNWKLYWKTWNSLAVWLGDLYKTTVYPFLFSIVTSQSKHWAILDTSNLLRIKFSLKYIQTPHFFWSFGWSALIIPLPGIESLLESTDKFRQVSET